MNLYRFPRLLLLMLFVLLQCVAPLAHAHVNNGHGDNTAQHVHFDSIDSSWLSDHHHEADATQLSAEGHHSAVVCLPPECRSGSLLIEQPVLASRHDQIMPGEYSAVVFGTVYRHGLASPPYQHPLSQAPPV